ncbi:MAG TPA: DUF2064 domain-containing protein [Trebonia sp.]|nr:DUF2064 domain-containing protein [Trebonia sp.]
METRFSLVPPWQRGEDEETLAVQVIALVQPAPPTGQAALCESLGAVLAAPVARRVLSAGTPDADSGPAGFDLIGQRSGGLGERIAGAMADAYANSALPMLLVRADTLGVTPDMLADAARSLVSGEADAAFGPAADDRFWLLGLRRPDRSLVVGIPDAGQGGGRLLLDRLATSGLRVALAPRLEVGGGEALPYSALRF